MYKPRYIHKMSDEMPLGPMQEAFRRGPQSVEEARAWMEANGIKPIDERASWDDVRPTSPEPRKESMPRTAWDEVV